MIDAVAEKMGDIGCC